MTRHQGMSKKGAVDAADLKEIVDCYFTLRRIMASLNHASPQQYPLMATVTTLKACWADLSGAQVAAGWSYPAEFVPSDGLAPNADRSGKPREKTYIEWGRRDLNNSTVHALTQPPPGGGGQHGVDEDPRPYEGQPPLGAPEI